MQLRVGEPTPSCPTSVVNAGVVAHRREPDPGFACPSEGTLLEGWRGAGRGCPQGDSLAGSHACWVGGAV